MTVDLLELVRALAGRRLLVIGDAVLDTYVRCAASGLAREAPVPVLRAEKTVHRCGGAANLAANAAALGAEVEIVTACGTDDAGDRLVALLRDAGVGVDGVLRLPDYSTPVKRRHTVRGQLVMRVDSGDGPVALPFDAGRWTSDLAERMMSADAVAISEYGGGMVTRPLVAALAGLRRVGPETLVVDARDIAALRDLRPTAVTPNREEAARLPPVRGEVPAGEQGDPRQLAERALRASGARIAVLTLGADGVVAVEHDRPPVRTYSRSNQVSSTVGAGDTFTAALTLALATGADTAPALELGSAAAAAVVARPDTAVCTADDLAARLGATGKVVTPGALTAWQHAHDRAERRLVFTNGCYDLLHAGHVSNLSRAKELGDLLVVGVNSDASVRRHKGPERPLTPLDERLRVLAALSCVDAVVPFDGDSPVDLLEALRPDVYVKGSDYTPETLPEWSLVTRLGGRVHLLENVADRSTTRLIHRIRALSGPGGPTSDEGSPR
ncbi:D-glycero-beta-D-manno-heptose 1-phosphate adenylyltransferase [Kitasatospora sp. NPDC101235]|uniref:D-glycero-beta-D-manno-heptose 1-phosphate adenylyltransferase n=1 Tax=Kitasatospora sp. NPDC101235 TaxID=3364101 RepID=UPI003807A7CC